MANIYDLFADWKKINKIIPMQKFYENGRMTEKQKSLFLREVSMARIMFIKEESHVVELKVENIYPIDSFTYSLVKAVFQTMPYEVTIILNCANKYYLLLIADLQERKRISAVNTDKIVTNIYSNGNWVDGERFDPIDLIIHNEPIDWQYFPNVIRVLNPIGFLEFTDDNGETIKLPYPKKYNVSKAEIDEYIAYAKEKYELNIQDEIDLLWGVDYELDNFWHITEQDFRARIDMDTLESPSYLEDEDEDKDVDKDVDKDKDKYNELFYGFIDGELLGSGDYDDYINDRRKR